MSWSRWCTPRAPPQASWHFHSDPPNPSARPYFWNVQQLLNKCSSLWTMSVRPNNAYTTVICTSASSLNLWNHATLIDVTLMVLEKNTGVINDIAYTYNLSRSSKIDWTQASTFKLIFSNPTNTNAARAADKLPALVSFPQQPKTQRSFLCCPPVADAILRSLKIAAFRLLLVIYFR